MILNVLFSAALTTAGLYMILVGKHNATRRMSWIPLSMAAMELAMFGALPVTEYPVITLLLLACRITVLTCCSRAMKRDAAMERNRRRRREVWRRVAATAPESFVVVGQHPTPAVRRCA